MKLTVKISALLLAALMLVSALVACGGTPDTTTPDVTTPEVTTPDVTTPDDKTPEEEYPAGLDVLLKGQNAKFLIELEYTGVNPWSYAMKLYNEWKEREPDIKAVGMEDAVATPDRESEYVIEIDFATAGQTGVDKNFNSTTIFGAGSKYEQRKQEYGDNKMRTVETLDDYTYVADDESLIDIYGGYMGWGKFAEGTGFFTTKFVDGRWWIIDPLGYPFFRTAVNTINSTNKMLDVFGSKEIWAQYTTDRLKELGFNSMGAWSALAELSASGSPLIGTQNLGVLRAYCGKYDLIGSSEPITAVEGQVLPMLNPDFEQYATEQITKAVTPYVDNTFVLGWMSDNEMPAKDEMLANYLASNKSVRYNYAYEYAVAWTFVYMETKDLNMSASRLTPELRTNFKMMAYDRYFTLITEILDEVDPNHLYLGARLLDAFFEDQNMMQVLGYHCDIITLNYYHRTYPFTEEVLNIAKWSGKPFMLTEWYAKGMDACTPESGLSNESGAGWTVRTQEDRGIYYECHTLKLLESKYCVGYDWFSYVDNDPANADSADASNTSSNKGLVTIMGNEYTDLTKHMSAVNNAKYSLIQFFDARR